MSIGGRGLPAEKAGESGSRAVLLYTDHHEHVQGLTAEAVADAHAKDLEAQEKYGVNYIKHWFNEEKGEIFCLVEAPSVEQGVGVTTLPTPPSARPKTDG